MRIQHLFLPFKPWAISALCSMLYVKGMVLLSVKVRQPVFNGCLQVDYLSHSRFFGTPLDSLDNLDGLVIWGVHYLFWCLAPILIARSSPVRHPQPKWPHTVSSICVHLSAGLSFFYLVLVWAMFSLAAHEGYHPMGDTIYRINHGPWHGISHLGFLVFYELLVIAAGALAAIFAFLFKFSLQTFFSCLLTIGLLVFHIKKLLAFIG